LRPQSWEKKMHVLFKTAQITIFASALIAMAGVMPSSSATLGVWEYDGYTDEEEGEGNADWSASVTMNHNGEEVMLTLGCSKPGKQFGILIGGREKFEKASYAAVKATKGKIEPDKSYLDVYIDDQIFSMNSMVFDINGELGFIDDFKPNGPVANAFLRGSAANLKAPGLNLAIPLKNSSNAICKALKQCGAKQAYCASTGR